MTFSRTDLFTYDKVEAVGSPGPKVTSPQGAFYDIMIGQGNYIQICIMLHMMKNLLNCGNTITVRTMHMQIGLTQLT